jgi:hypothetical protein
MVSEPIVLSLSPDFHRLSGVGPLQFKGIQLNTQKKFGQKLGTDNNIHVYEKYERR